MFKCYYSSFKTITTVLLLSMMLVGKNYYTSIAQTNNSANNSEQIMPLHSGVNIIDFTGKLHVLKTYYCVNCGHDGIWKTELQVEIRNINMLNSNLGLGYKALVTVYMTGFLKKGGFGGIGAGPLVRYYPLNTKKWQPYLQIGFLASSNLALGSAKDVGHTANFRYRANLRGGLSYRMSNAFGLFLEVGRTWEYVNTFDLAARSLQFQLGFELFRF